MSCRAWGIAGYMGAGKSSAARILARCLDAVIIDADAEAKRMMSNDAGLIERLTAEFGPAILEQNRLSFPRLGAIVFQSLDALVRLNRIVHPLLLQRLASALGLAQGRCYILDAALIPLWGVESWFDALLWIDAQRSVRVGRIAASSPLPRHEIENRCALQEALFPAPTAAPWRIVANQGTLDELSVALMACIAEEGDATGAKRHTRQ